MYVYYVHFHNILLGIFHISTIVVQKSHLSSFVDKALLHYNLSVILNHSTDSVQNLAWA